MLGDDDGVLVVSGEAAIGGTDGPAVAVEGDAAGGGGDDGLDGDDEAFGEEMARLRMRQNSGRWALRGCAADAVAA